MDLITKAVRGTRDILPKDSYKWRFLESILLDETENYGFKEIRTPVFEHTELFKRSVGDDTDIVQKEMYTFEDKGGRSITLRPEGTAPTVRSMLENGLYNEGLPVKLCYLDACYRYEKPQAGRYREFVQFGSEVFGTSHPTADIELINLASSIFERLGLLDKFKIEINSIGCPECRKQYYNALKNYFNNQRENLCPTCIDRLEKNPMRILDCKNQECAQIAEKAPSVLDFLCGECSEHFEFVKKGLSSLNIEYTVNPKIVRGLDYYTKTVFEFIVKDGDQKGLVCGGGGRYDGLVSEMGGQNMPALGFGLGVDRLLLAMESFNIEISEPKTCDIYIASIGESANLYALSLAKELRQASFYAQVDLSSKSLKAQMKYADKIKAKFTIVLGDDEISQKKAKIKNMENGEQSEIRLDEEFLSDFFKIHTEMQTPGIFSELLKGN